MNKEFLLRKRVGRITAKLGKGWESGKWDLTLRCSCSPVFTGHTRMCSIRFCSCSPGLCMCLIDIATFKSNFFRFCSCSPGFTGQLCERTVCNANPCLHGGTCLGKTKVIYEPQESASSACISRQNVIFSYQKLTSKKRFLCVSSSRMKCIPIDNLCH